jgi:hypothetical protein
MFGISYLILIAVLSSVVGGVFRYLRHRAYLNTARYLCDRHGLPALRTFLQLTARERTATPDPELPKVDR